MDNQIKILGADDHQIVVKGFKGAFEDEPELNYIGSVTKLENLLPTIIDKQPDVLLLDLRWGPDWNGGAEIIGKIKNQFPDIYIISITVHDHLAPAALAAGADLVVGKEIPIPDLVKRIKDADEKIKSNQKARNLIMDLNEIPIGDRKAAPRHEACVFEILTSPSCNPSKSPAMLTKPIWEPYVLSAILVIPAT